MFESVTPHARGANPWHALWALLVGFFMILVDATIVPVANPAIMAQLHVDYDAVIWVTSAYLLAYAVPLLVAGRLGDRYGPKTMYLIGLSVFTVASLWCGLSDSISTLVAARVLQGVGAALLTPQTLTVITRTFPAAAPRGRDERVGCHRGVATLVGPLAGGVLVDTLGWQWIFIVNVPVGIVGLALAVWLVPTLPTQHRQRFDVPGVVLSGVGMFLIVFALQEGQSHDWTRWIWALIAAGDRDHGRVRLLAVGQPRRPTDPAGHLQRPQLLDVQPRGGDHRVRRHGDDPAADVLRPGGVRPDADAVGVADRADGGRDGRAGAVRRHASSTARTRARWSGFGFSLMAIGLTWLSIEMTPTTPIWRLVLPLTAMGVAMAFIWSPLAATATRNLPPQLAGAGSGVYNTTRQVGSVLGSAGMAALMASELSAKVARRAGGAARPEGQVAELPPFLHAPFAAAMSQSMLLPAFVALFGVIAALFLFDLVRSSPPPAPQQDAEPEPAYDPDHELYWADGEDEYVEFEVSRDPDGVRRRDGPTPRWPTPTCCARSPSRSSRRTRTGSGAPSWRSCWPSRSRRRPPTVTATTDLAIGATVARCSPIPAGTPATRCSSVRPAARWSCAVPRPARPAPCRAPVPCPAGTPGTGRVRR